MHKNIVKAIKYEQRYNKNLKGLKKTKFFRRAHSNQEKILVGVSKGNLW